MKAPKWTYIGVLAILFALGLNRKTNLVVDVFAF
jgi:hypothetical protein